MATTPALVRIESLTPVEIFKPGALDSILDHIKGEAREEAAHLDISTETNRKALASLAYKIARSKTFIDAQRKALVSDEKKRLAVIDAEGKRIWNELESLQNEIRKPLTDWEDAENKRVADLESSLAEIVGAGPYSLQNWQMLSVEAMRDRMAEIQTARNWQEFSSRADYAIRASLEQIAEAIEKREAWENQQKELARLRAEAEERTRREREEMIARAAREEAERKAKEREHAAARAAEAERQRIAQEKFEAEARAKAAEAARVAAEERAVREAKEAAERAELQKKEAVEAERRRIAQEAEAKRREEEAREKNRQHRAKIHNAIKTALMESVDLAPGNTLSAYQAEEIVKAIAKGAVHNVSIAY